MFEKFIEAQDEVLETALMTYPLVIVSNREIQIENYKKLFSFSDSKIRIIFSRKNDAMELTGSKFKITKMTKDILKFKGNIYSVVFVNRGGNNENIRNL